MEPSTTMPIQLLKYDFFLLKIVQNDDFKEFKFSNYDVKNGKSALARTIQQALDPLGDVRY